MQKSLVIIIIFFGFSGLANAQKTQAKPTKANHNKPQEMAAESIIRTNNPDTLYYDLDNSIILTPTKELQKTVLNLTATQGEITKLANNFFQLGNLTGKSVTVTVIEEKSKKKIEEKTFVCAKQVLPF